MTFDDLRGDFLRIVSDVVWCTVATVDTQGRPRPRVMHPYGEVVEAAPVGWVGTSRSALKSRHLAANPHVSCSYRSPRHETAHVECLASWAEAEPLMLLTAEDAATGNWYRGVWRRG